MTREYCKQLRWRVVFLSREGWGTSEIASRLHVGKTFVTKILKLFRENHSIEYPPRPGKIRQLGARDILTLKRIIELYPEVYRSDELQEWLEYLTARTFSIHAIKRCINKMGYSRKKLNLIARQQNDRCRAEFRRRVAQFETHQFIFVDESSKDERTFQRKYARSLRGCKVSVKGNFTRGTRYSILGAITVDGLVASHTIVGAYNKQQFEFAMNNFVIPHVGSVARREASSVVVLDNCAIHSSDNVITAVRNRGGIVVFLPPYSPDMNPIEEAFGSGKTWLQRNTDICIKYPKRCFELALQQITADQCKGFLEDSGFF